jgi:alpha-glucoside transport system substrate-binding protein
MPRVLLKLNARVLAMAMGAVLFSVTACGGSSTAAGNNCKTLSTTPSGTSTYITIWPAWGGQELKAFQDVLAPFEQSTGITIDITTNRSSSQLATAVNAGAALPDISFGPTIDKLQDWICNKGVMHPIEDVLGSSAFNDYVSGTYAALTTPPSGQTTDLYIGVVNGKHYEEMVKTQVKGLFWYNKHVFTGTPPTSFNDLLNIDPTQYGAQKLFCAGLSSGDASGWPASDQIDNIIMRQNSASFYTDWIQGKVKFSDPRIKKGYQTYLQEVSDKNVYGGANTVLSTAFGQAGDPLFKSPGGGMKAGCLFLEQATFIPNFFTQDFPSLNLKAGVDYDFFAHPTIDPQYDGNVNGYYDQMAVFNFTPAVQKLMRYLATAQAQQIWADDGGTLTALKSITYKDPVYARAATVASGAKNLLVTAGDFMPSDMQKAFWKSLLDATKDPSTLDSVLARLDQVQASAYAAA